MKIAIMQPYFFPYIGYWQLMNAVDIYVVFDDVNYINRGWINRNRILFHGTSRYFNLPMHGASQNKLINEIEVDKNSSLADRNLSIIKEAYGKAPFFSDVFPLIDEVLTSTADDVASFLEDSFRILCRYLEINTKRVRSSELKNDKSLKGEEKIIDICNILGADHYINPIGGMDLYHEDRFHREQMELSFLHTLDISYRQFGDPFEKDLSIIDVMMFNSRNDIREMLGRYELLSGR